RSGGPDRPPRPAHALGGSGLAGRRLPGGGPRGGWRHRSRPTPPLVVEGRPGGGRIGSGPGPTWGRSAWPARLPRAHGAVGPVRRTSSRGRDTGPPAAAVVA